MERKERVLLSGLFLSVCASQLVPTISPIFGNKFRIYFEITFSWISKFIVWGANLPILSTLGLSIDHFYCSNSFQTKQFSLISTSAVLLVTINCYWYLTIFISRIFSHCPAHSIVDCRLSNAAGFSNCYFKCFQVALLFYPIQIVFIPELVQILSRYLSFPWKFPFFHLISVYKSFQNL